MNIKRVMAWLIAMCIIVAFSACGQREHTSPETTTACSHDWCWISCTMPMECSICGVSQETVVGHDFEKATCISSKRCKICDTTQGEPYGHDYVAGVCFRCNERQTGYFFADEYGFLSEQDMGRWIEITGYSFSNGYVEYDESIHSSVHGNQRAMKFLNGVAFEYDTSELIPSPYHSDTAHYYTVSNDMVIVGDDEISIEIIERVVLGERLVLKTIWNGSSENWFILEEMIDWDRVQKIDNPENPEKQIRRYFLKSR